LNNISIDGILSIEESILSLLYTLYCILILNYELKILNEVNITDFDKNSYLYFIHN